MADTTVKVVCNGVGVYETVTAAFFDSDPSAPEWSDPQTSLSLSMTVDNTLGTAFVQGAMYELTLTPAD